MLDYTDNKLNEHVILPSSFPCPPVCVCVSECVCECVCVRTCVCACVCVTTPDYSPSLPYGPPLQFTFLRLVTIHSEFEVFM